MSYAQRKEMSGNRTAAIVVVALVHILLGYAIVTGLAYNVLKKTAADLKTFDVTEPPPPPEEPPPPPKDNTPPPPMVSAPPPMVRFDTPPLNIQTTPIIQPPLPPAPMAPPAPPAPPAPRVSQPKSVSGNLQGLIRNDDYPESAIQNEEQGSVSVVLQVGANGRVTGCSVSASSGSRTLDSTTCRILSSRARFTPAQDSSGAATSSTFRQTIKWVLQ
jgi:protein TonB